MAGKFFIPRLEDGKPFDFPTRPEDHIINLLPDSDFYDSNTFMCVGKDKSLIQIQCFCATFYPMYTHRPGVFMRVLDSTGKELAVFKEQFTTKDLVQDGPSFRLPGFNFQWKEGTGYEIVVDHASCPAKGTITVAALEGGGVKFGEDGKIGLNADKSQFAQFFYFVPRGVTTAALTINKSEFKFDGYAFGCHFVQNVKPHHLALNWQYIKFHSDEFTINSTMLHAPKALHGDNVFHGTVVYKEKLLAVTIDNQVINHSKQYDKASGYDIPTDVEFQLRGMTREATPRPFSAVCRLVPKNRTAMFDILAELPWLLRSIVKALVARPFHYQWIDDAEFNITIGDEKIVAKGIALHEATYINP